MQGQVVGQEGAAVAALGHVGAEHEVINDELLAAGEKLGESGWTVRAGEFVGFGDVYYRKVTALGGKSISCSSVLFFLGEEIETGSEPIFTGCNL